MNILEVVVTGRALVVVLWGFGPNCDRSCNGPNCGRILDRIKTVWILGPREGAVTDLMRAGKAAMWEFDFWIA